MKYSKGSNPAKFAGFWKERPLWPGCIGPISQNRARYRARARARSSSLVEKTKLNDPPLWLSAV
jgi:hypothetical protein